MSEPSGYHAVTWSRNFPDAPTKSSNAIEKSKKEKPKKILRKTQSSWTGQANQDMENKTKKSREYYRYDKCLQLKMRKFLTEEEYKKLTFEFVSLTKIIDNKFNEEAAKQIKTGMEKLRIELKKLQDENIIKDIRELERIVRDKRTIEHLTKEERQRLARWKDVCWKVRDLIDGVNDWQPSVHEVATLYINAVNPSVVLPHSRTAANSSFWLQQVPGFSVPPNIYKEQTTSQENKITARPLQPVVRRQELLQTGNSATLQQMQGRQQNYSRQAIPHQNPLERYREFQQNQQLSPYDVPVQHIQRRPLEYVQIVPQNVQYGVPIQHNPMIQSPPKRMVLHPLEMNSGEDYFRNIDSNPASNGLFDPNMPPMDISPHRHVPASTGSMQIDSVDNRLEVLNTAPVIQPSSSTTAPEIVPFIYFPSPLPTEKYNPYKSQITRAQHDDGTLIVSNKKNTVRMCDIYRLQPEKYLNDDLIEYGCATLVFQHLQGDELTHIMPVRFFPFLVYSNKRDERGAQIDLWFKDRIIPNDDYQQWKRNCKNVFNGSCMNKLDFFSKKFIVVPIVQELHWMLAVIFNPAGAIVESGAECKLPCRIIFFNSIANDSETLYHFSFVLREMLKEFFELKKPSSEARILHDRIIFSAATNIPQQKNTFDCGLFLLHNAERIIQNLDAFEEICENAGDEVNCFELFRDVVETQKTDLRVPFFEKIMSKADNQAREYVNKQITELKKNQSQRKP